MRFQQRVGANVGGLEFRISGEAKLSVDAAQFSDRLFFL